MLKVSPFGHDDMRTEGGVRVRNCYTHCEHRNQNSMSNKTATQCRLVGSQAKATYLIFPSSEGGHDVRLITVIAVRSLRTNCYYSLPHCSLCIYVTLFPLATVYLRVLGRQILQAEG